MKNSWQLCSKNPPPQYTRVEIKSLFGKRYCGYRYKNQYYSTFGNFIIKDPYKWRWIPETSALYAEILHRIKTPMESFGLAGAKEGVEI